MTTKAFPDVEGASFELPGYRDPKTEDPPPDYSYTAPSKYTVGNQVVSQPFVSIEQLKAHLTLLRAFKILRTSVEEDTENRLPEHIRALKDQSSGSSLRWGCVVALAVERYRRRFIKRCVPFTLTTDSLTP
jgi:hypothetical protein